MKSDRNDSEKVPLKKALLWIFFSALAVSGSTWLCFLYYQHVRDLHANDDTFKIVAIVQTSSQQEILKTVYLAELLDLSLDKPVNLYSFNTKDARRKLLSNPLIRQANVKKIRPGTVYIDYALRQPVAFLADFTNTAIDVDGYTFPFKPFFTPKKLPEIFLGLLERAEVSLNKEKIWGESIKDKHMLLALSVLDYISTNYRLESLHIRRIDVSRAFAPSCGQRQIVIALEDQIEKEMNGKSILFILPRILRLSSKDYEQGLANYKILRSELMKKSMPDSEGPIVKIPAVVIDLRLSNLAFMSK
jgi:hypothetical protein